MTDSLTELEAKRRCSDYIHEQTGGAVISGPFKGMKILRAESWQDGNHGTKLLGCYEQELHDDIEREIARLSPLPCPVILNIGCAEGYYAVGMGMRLPAAAIHVIDIDDEARLIAQRNGGLNNVLVVPWRPSDFAEVVSGADLIICDCEGEETEYLDPVKYPKLAHIPMIVECHDCNGKQCNTILMKRFNTVSHSIKVIFEGARNPNSFPMLWPYSSIERWTAVSEGRPCLMNWLVMTPNQPKASI